MFGKYLHKDLPKIVFCNDMYRMTHVSQGLVFAMWRIGPLPASKIIKLRDIKLFLRMTESEYGPKN
jgi:hypothetical protein